jgi:hypothetical protein
MAPAPHTRPSLVVPLVQGISITLIEDENGCAFGSWARSDAIVLLPPSKQDRQRRFPTPAAAVAFFRKRYKATPCG